jgi:mannosyltransferase
LLFIIFKHIYGEIFEFRDFKVVDVSEIEVVATNFKKRLSGVTSTIIQLIPEQQKSGLKISVLGSKLPGSIPQIGYFSILKLWKKPKIKCNRIWHARRNNEMLLGIISKYLLGMPIKLVFTSAAQREHTKFTKWMIKRMDRVIATSKKSGSFLEVKYDVVMHGIDVNLFKPSLNQKAEGVEAYLIGCFGRVRHSKGTDLFVEAMIELLPEFPEWTALVCGRVTAPHKSFSNALQLKVNEANLSDRIIFMGEVVDIKPFYQDIDLYVAPSRNEGFGLTPLEAMASGTMVIASDAGSYEEMILPGQTGEIVPAGNQELLTRAIEQYFSKPSKAIQGKELCRKHVEDNFQIISEVNGVSKVYKSLEP